MGEHTQFRPDTETTPEGKNGMLGALLLGAWNKLTIVKVERVAGTGEQGWQVTYRD
jgi:hypothetical protein